MVKKRWGMRVKRGMGVGPFWGFWGTDLRFLVVCHSCGKEASGFRIKTAPAGTGQFKTEAAARGLCYFIQKYIRCFYTVYWKFIRISTTFIKI